MADDSMRECLRISLNSLLPSLKIDHSLTEKQFEALYSFIRGNEVYVSLPTGSGKSLIFQLVPLVHKWMYEHKKAPEYVWIKDPIIVIICPLLTLMQDQVNMLKGCGKKASYIGGNDQAEEAMKDIENGKFTYVFLSPESALSNERWRNMLSSKVYRDNLVGIVIDEVHCVTEWGLSNEKNAFRKWYSRLNEARSLVKVPFMALTATATKINKNKIFELLELTSPIEIVESPNKNNVRYCVQLLDKNVSLLENFRCVVEEVRNKGRDTQRTIIYCQTVKQCSILFKIFEMELKAEFYVDRNIHPRHRLVEMLHSQTPNSVKEQFSNDSTHLRILIKSVQAYIQESGRCGRMGEKSIALLLYNGLTLRIADTSMKEYVKSEDVCRRKMLMKHFDTPLPSDVPSGHNCCDVCTESCKCQGDSCDQDLHLPCDAELLSSNTNQACRQVSQQQKDMLFHKLKHLQKMLMMKVATFSENSTQILSCPTVFLQFGKEQISQIVEQSDILFTQEDILKHVDIWKRKHATAVLEILYQVFKDIEMPMACDDDEEESDDEEFENEWEEIMNDPSFLELLGESQWEQESFTFTDEQDSIVEAHSST